MRRSQEDSQNPQTYIQINVTNIFTPASPHDSPARPPPVPPRPPPPPPPRSLKPPSKPPPIPPRASHPIARLTTYFPPLLPSRLRDPPAHPPPLAPNQDIYKKLPNGPDSAKSLLWNKPAGTFLVRESSSQVSDYALDVKVSSGTVHHMRIKTRWLKHGKSFAIITQRPKAEKQFSSLDALLVHLSEDKSPWLPLV